MNNLQHTFIKMKKRKLDCVVRYSKPNLVNWEIIIKKKALSSKTFSF